MFQVACDDCTLCEKLIIELFKNKYEQILKYGVEYFQGDLKIMICDIIKILKKEYRVDYSGANDIEQLIIYTKVKGDSKRLEVERK